MERQHERDLEILTAIDEGEPLTQRALAQRLGVALGLANLYLKRLAVKGSIKIVEFPRKPAARKRLRYLLTPTGMAEKTRLTYESGGKICSPSAIPSVRKKLVHGPGPAAGQKTLPSFRAFSSSKTLRESSISNSWPNP